MDITSVLTSMFTGITAVIAIYNQTKIKQKLYVNSNLYCKDYIVIHVLVCNNEKYPICISIDTDNKHIINLHTDCLGKNGFILESNSSKLIHIGHPLFVNSNEYSVLLMKSNVNKNKCVMVTIEMKTNRLNNIIKKINHIIKYYS